MVGYTGYVVYPVVQFILKVHQLIFSEDLLRRLTAVLVHAFICFLVTKALCPALGRIGNTETVFCAICYMM